MKIFVSALVFTVSVSLAQQRAPTSDSSYIDAQGTAHVTRVIPVPRTVSPEAQELLARQISDAAHPQTLEERRRLTDAWQMRAGAASRAMYPVNITGSALSGVPVRIVTPLQIPADKRVRVLINVHGGGFNSDSGSLTESIPIANLTQTKVVSVLYRLAPEHPFPASVDDTVAVYKELLKNYLPKNIAFYGTSTGAILTAETTVPLKHLGLPLPGALGVFSGLGDFSLTGDSQAMYTLGGLSGHLDPPTGTRTTQTTLAGQIPEIPFYRRFTRMFMAFRPRCSLPAGATSS